MWIFSRFRKNHSKSSSRKQFERASNKMDAYADLVRRRKNCRRCVELTNPSEVSGGRYDSEEIGPWTRWQGNLDAEIMVVGQDWGDVACLVQNQGIEPKFNTTNENLRVLLGELGVQIAPPNRGKHDLFFTNAMLCLKDGGLQARIQDHCLNTCVSGFLVPLIEIVSPRVVVCMSKNATCAILSVHGIPYKKSANYSSIIDSGPYKLRSGSLLFPVFHCGARGVNQNRALHLQKEDWRQISEFMRG